MLLAGLLYFWAFHLTFSWWANVFYLIALGYYCRGNWALAATWALVATGLAMSWSLLDPVATNAPAFQLWTGSMAALAAGSVALARWLPQRLTEHPAQIG
jgi:hypothetical protein